MAHIEENISTYQDTTKVFAHWEKTKDIVDQLIDLILNYRQSGHPGGSHSKTHIFISLLLSGIMRWDIRHPEKPFADRFVLGAGHAAPLVYCTLAVFNEALRIKYQQTADSRYAIPNADEQALFWEDLLTFRRLNGLPGMAEMSGKTLFLRFNTGPSGHGTPPAAGMAVALKRSGANNVRVFLLEGEAGLTTGASYETMLSAWGLKLDNLYFLVDWNNFGIDEHPIDQSIYGTPSNWFSAYGWRVFHTESGCDWDAINQLWHSMVESHNPDQLPTMAWVKTQKGRAYLKHNHLSHGAPHKINTPLFWETKRSFSKKYQITFANFGEPAPDDPEELMAEFRENLQRVINVLHTDQTLVDYLANRLVTLGECVPQQIPSFSLGKQNNPYEDEQLYDYQTYPHNLFVSPGTHISNREALAKWGAWVNAFGAKKYNRPLFLACSADLAESTRVNGFAEAFGDFPGYGWWGRYGTPQGVLLPQEITEFANAGIMAGMATVNFAPNPQETFDGFWGICSTYGAFSYLKYGMMRLFSQISQVSPLKMGKVIWVAGHSGLSTADDGLTHFGIFSPGVTQLFPTGSVINLYPWEHNEVPVLLGAALRQPAPIVVLHLTRQSITIPNRHLVGMPSHMAAATGAYIVRPYDTNYPHQGTIIVQGTTAMESVVKILPLLTKQKLNVKIVCVTSPQLFAAQPKAYRQQVLSAADCLDSTVISTHARVLMQEWLFTQIGAEYVLSPDWDNRWRTGGTMEEVVNDAHLSPEWVMAGIKRFAHERNERLSQIRSELDMAQYRNTNL